MTLTIAYLLYLAICVGITVWVARTLRTHGHVFLTQGHETRTKNFPKRLPLAGRRVLSRQPRRDLFRFEE